MSPRNKRETYAVIAIVALTGLTFLYTVFLGQPLQYWFAGWSSIVISLTFLYLVWRFVRATERIADALE